MNSHVDQNAFTKANLNNEVAIDIDRVINLNKVDGVENLNVDINDNTNGEHMQIQILDQVIQ